jgi:hypothetical protein
MADHPLRTATDLYAQAGGHVRKTAENLWTPRFQPGDIVLVDRADSDHVKVIDPQLQIGERVEKRRVTVTGDGCTCPMRTLMVSGCPRTRGANTCAKES